MQSVSVRCSAPAAGRASGVHLPVLFTIMLGFAFLLSAGNVRAASTVEPAALESMRALALELLRARDYDRSIAVYHEIAKQTPDDAKSHYDLAAALSFVQRYEEAALPIRHAIRLTPHDLKVQEMASLIFLNLGWYQQAFEATLKAAELGEPTAMYSLVNMYEKGLGVGADDDKAAYWAIQAAEHGHLGAMALMEQAHRNGRLGRRVDPKAAKRWAAKLSEAKSAWK